MGRLPCTEHVRRSLLLVTPNHAVSTSYIYTILWAMCCESISRLGEGGLSAFYSTSCPCFSFLYVLPSLVLSLARLS
ncbi:hypothetical protein BDQ94DRAFT_143730 [Aspergillus welwitschiae]|uniref:Uncharacterized protein n=1 Tax=Aspergillus welwitschiae TaxID=1341132 RepID=A0A3F3Q1U1_9EURO|nr:hypothetical protein BDQ94DRAFT_143730 [Aspergillus welwitschiae]RDH33173.1 hypothetical protein BDQ94DRAFT_143730 [Aspergillus welwitschiae]